MKDCALLKYLDSPMRVITFSVNELVAYAIPFFLGVILDSLLIVSCVGMTLVYIINKALKRLPKFYLIGLIYWFLPTNKFNKTLKVNLPSSSKRLWVK